MVRFIYHTWQMNRLSDASRILGKFLLDFQLYRLTRVTTNRPVVAPYVTSLIMRPHELGYYMKSASGITGFLSEAFWQMKEYVDGKAIPPGAAAARILLRNISKMTNVMSLKIIHLWSDAYPYFIMALPLIKGALLASGKRIRELSLDIPVESYEHVFPPDLNLNSLERLNVTMHNQPSFLGKSDYAEHLAATFVPFISRHLYTIKHISVDVPYRQVSVDLSSVFIGFRDRLPHLTSLSISVPLEYLYKPGFHVPLENHSASLEELKLILYPPFLRQDVLLPPSELFALPMFKIEFPSLKVLDIDLWMWPESERQFATKSLVNYLLPIHGTLSTLILRHYRFCASDICSIFRMRANLFPRLFHLQICVRYLNVEIFDILSTCLSNLSKLSIHFDTLGENASDSDNDQNSYIVSDKIILLDAT